MAPSVRRGRSARVSASSPKRLLRPSRYKTPTWHSGYNEVILSSVKYNEALPGALLAFFMMEEREQTWINDPYSHGVDMKKVQSTQRASSLHSSLML